jgi:hypothetical protein
MDDVEETIEIKCFDCKKEITKKPWITLSCDNGDFFIYGCSYICSKYLPKYMGGPYYDKIVNKEDFNEPRPISNSCTQICIMNNEEIEGFKYEIEQEEKRIEAIENDYNDSSKDEYDTDDY